MPIRFDDDPRIVMTLDAGGTNLKFSAIRGNRLLVGPISIPSEADDLARCLGNIVRGFEDVRQALPAPPVAISFAFPGPADSSGRSSASRPSSTTMATCSRTAKPSPGSCPT